MSETAPDTTAETLAPTAMAPSPMVQGVPTASGLPPQMTAPVPSPAELKPDAPSDSWWELLRILLLALLIALVERTLFYQPYNIPSGSMEDTLLVGDFLFVEKFAYGYNKFALPWGQHLPDFSRVLAREPARGDVVVFALPSDPSRDFVKRIIGLPGDRVQVLHGVVYLNDRPVPKIRDGVFVENDNGYVHRVARYRETLPGGRSYDVLDKEIEGPNDNTPVYTVPRGHYFVLGDNRDDSDDSRGIVGYLPADYLIGKAELKFFSIDERKTKAWTFWHWPSAIRFERLFRVIH